MENQRGMHHLKSTTSSISDVNGSFETSLSVTVEEGHHYHSMIALPSEQICSSPSSFSSLLSLNPCWSLDDGICAPPSSSTSSFMEPSHDQGNYQLDGQMTRSKNNDQTSSPPRRRLDPVHQRKALPLQPSRRL